jgi:hypothetical protein
MPGNVEYCLGGGVSQHRLSCLWRFAKLQHGGGEGMADIVHAAAGKPDASQQREEVPVKIHPGKRAAVGLTEDQAVVFITLTLMLALKEQPSRPWDRRQPVCPQRDPRRALSPCE